MELTHILEGTYKYGGAQGSFRADIAITPITEELLRFEGRIIDPQVVVPEQDVVGQIYPRLNACHFLKMPGASAPVCSIIYDTVRHGSDPLNASYRGHWYAIPKQDKSSLSVNPDLFRLLKSTTEIFNQGEVHCTIARKASGGD